MLKDGPFGIDMMVILVKLGANKNARSTNRARFSTKKCQFEAKVLLVNQLRRMTDLSISLICLIVS